MRSHEQAGCTGGSCTSQQPPRLLPPPVRVLWQQVLQAAPRDATPHAQYAQQPACSSAGSGVGRLRHGHAASRTLNALHWTVILHIQPCRLRPSCTHPAAPTCRAHGAPRALAPCAVQRRASRRRRRQAPPQWRQSLSRAAEPCSGRSAAAGGAWPRSSRTTTFRHQRCRARVGRRQREAPPPPAALAHCAAASRRRRSPPAKRQLQRWWRPEARPAGRRGPAGGGQPQLASPPGPAWPAAFDVGDA